MGNIQARAAQAVSQIMSLNMLMWLTMLTLFAAILYLAAAVYMAIAMALGPPLAALLTGLSLLGVFILLVAVIVLALRQPDKTVAETAKPRVDNAVEHNLRPLIGNRATDWTRDNTGIAITGALAAGVLLAASPRLRHFVVRSAGPIITRKIIRSVQEFTDH